MLKDADFRQYGAVDFERQTSGSKQEKYQTRHEWETARSVAAAGPEWPFLNSTSYLRSTMGQGQSAPSTPAPTPALPAGHPPVASPGSAQPPAECPMHAEINPANNMPATLAQSPAPGQSIALPQDRTESSIPRAPSPDGAPAPTPKWEYPSPQQFYNALVRKGWETPEEHVETMVHIHNFLNEEAWNEVLKWEGTSNPYV